MDALIGIIIVIGGLLLILFLLTARRWWPAWKVLREQRSRLNFVCRSCGYSRTGLPRGGTICPECGAILEPLNEFFDGGSKSNDAASGRLVNGNQST